MFISKCKSYLTHLFHTRCLAFNQKKCETHKKAKQKQMIAKGNTKEDSEMAQLSGLSDTGFKTNMIDMLKDMIGQMDIFRKKW